MALVGDNHVVMVSPLKPIINLIMLFVSLANAALRRRVIEKVTASYFLEGL